MHWRQFITKGNNTSCLTIGAKQCCLHTEEIKYFHLLLGLENQVTLFWLYLTFLWLICYLIRLRCLGNNPRFIYLVSKSKYGAMWVKPYIHVLQRNLTYLCYSCFRSTTGSTSFFQSPHFCYFGVWWMCSLSYKQSYSLRAQKCYQTRHSKAATKITIAMNHQNTKAMGDVICS